MNQFTTVSGSTFDLSKPVRSNLIFKFTGFNDRRIMQELSIVKISGTHEEFGELKTDFIVKDEFGETHEICEDFIWH